MNASVDRTNVQATALTNESAPESAAAPHQSLAAVAPVTRETAPAADDKICWIEVRQAPYHPNQQVELLHLQAEAEALLLQLQTNHQRRQSSLGSAEAPSV